LNYQAALDYLYSFINYEKIGMAAITAANYNLERVGYLLEELGNPQYKYPAIVIAGTKGKGSTAALSAAALQAAGYRVALYSQPHLHTYRERMQINHKLISRSELIGLIPTLRPAIEATLARSNHFGRLTFYEVGTALALLYFAEQKVDFAILEIGLGGRLDAVNVVEPLVSVITSISYDHMDVLGDTLTKIASEKAGIIKPGIPVVSAPQIAEAGTVIETVCREKAASLQIVEPAQALPFKTNLSQNQRWQPFQLVSLPASPESFELPLLGDHQLINLALAARAIETQAQAGRGLKVSQAQMEQGFAQVQWPGRLEVLSDKPGSPLVMVDGAHNAASAQRLAQALNPANFYYQRLCFIVATSADKDIAGIFRELQQTSPAPIAFILTQAQHARALPALQLRQQGFGPAQARESQPEIIVTQNVSEALAKASDLAGPLDLICATGSLFLVAEVREAFGRGQEKD